MIRSSASMAADDVCVNCRVRRSKTASNPSFYDFESMTVTMRKWTKRNGKNTISSRLLASGSCPELILYREAQQRPMMSRERSFGSLSRKSGGGASIPGGILTGSDSFEQQTYSSYQMSRKRSNSVHNQRKIWDDLRQLSMKHDDEQQQKPGDEVAESGGPITFTIPLQEVVVVDVMGSSLHAARDEDRPLRPIYMTTVSHGYFEFSFGTHNSHDVLLAFLTGSLRPERIVYQQQKQQSFRKANLSSESIDVEGLTAHQMRNRVRRETIFEKLRRKTSHMASRFTELTLSITDCACGTSQPRESPVIESPVHHPNQNVVMSAMHPLRTPSPHPSQHQQQPQEEATEDSKHVYSMLEYGKETPLKEDNNDNNSRPDLCGCKIPSGMSMEESTKSFCDSTSELILDCKSDALVDSMAADVQPVVQAH